MYQLGARLMKEGNKLLLPINTDLILGLEPEELALLILSYLKSGGSSAVGQDTISLGHIAGELLGDEFRGPTMERNKREECERAIIEAWGWLEANSLLAWSDASNGISGFRRLSRRAEKLSPKELKLFQSAARLSPENLHLRIREKVWSNFLRGDYDSAVFQAAKGVEISVKEKSGLDKIGVPLMRAAFHQSTGFLTDATITAGEQQARSDLFAGFIGSYKNPGSHRDVDLDDPIEAMQVVLFASHLLNIVDNASINKP